MKLNRVEAQEHIIKELLFDLSFDDKTVRASAIHNLVQFAAHDAVIEAVKQRYGLEQDPYCKKGLEEILKNGTREPDTTQIRLVEKPFKLDEPLNAAEEDKTKTARPDEIVPAIITQQKTFKAKLAELVDFLKLKLEWATQNNLKASNLGMVVILVVLVSFTTIAFYSIIRSGERFSFSGLEKSDKPRILGEIQTEDVVPGSILKGTLVEYSLFGQNWVFISDDDKLFKIKLDKAPSFYKVQDKLNVVVEACEKNTLGHIVLIAKVTSLEKETEE